MTSPEPPPPGVAERVRRAGAGTGPRGPRTLRRRLAVRLAALLRWLHIYLSMFSLAVVLFFAVTGLTLNHPGWFPSGPERSAEAEGAIGARWLNLDTPPAPGGGEPDPARGVDRLHVVEHLRASHGVRGAVADFRVEGRECVVSFKGPGYAADAFVDRDSGRYRLSETSHGLVAVLNDLHKGRDTGPAWSILIDASAVLLALASLTGLALLFYLKLRRRPGLAVALIGAAAVWAVWAFGPGAR